MECVECRSAAVSERRDRAAQGHRRSRCRDCGRQFNERSAGVLNRTLYPSDVIALVVLWRLRYRLTLQERYSTKGGRDNPVCIASAAGLTHKACDRLPRALLPTGIHQATSITPDRVMRTDDRHSHATFH